MKEWIAAYTEDGGQTIKKMTVSEETYTKAYLAVSLKTEGDILSLITMASYKVTTNNGVTRTLAFTEHHTENNYGNGNHITVVNVDADEIIAYVDMRYQNYVFETFCENYIKNYYGTNLLTYEHIS